MSKDPLFPVGWPTGFRLSHDANVEFQRIIDEWRAGDAVILGWLVPAPGADLSSGAPGFSIGKISDYSESIYMHNGSFFVVFPQGDAHVSMYENAILQYDDLVRFTLTKDR